MHSLLSLLNKWNPKIVLVVCILLVIYVSFLTHRIGSDQLVQLGTVSSLLNGDGYNLLALDKEGQIVKQGLGNWPYGYRILATPIMFITGRSAEATFLIILFFGQALLLFSVFLLLTLLPLSYSRPVSNFVLIFLSISTSPLRYFSDVDCLTLAVYLLSLYFLLRYFHSEGKRRYFLLFILLLSAQPFLRYAYVAQSVSLLVFFIAADYYTTKVKDKPKYLLLLIPFLVLAFTASGNYFADKSIKYANVGKLTLSGRSFIPIYYAPFFNSFFPDYILVSFLSKFTSWYARLIVPVLVSFSAVSLAVLVYMGCAYRREQAFRRTMAEKWLNLETLLLFTLVINLLFIVGIRNVKTITWQDIYSGLFAYKTLAVSNRYFAALHISTLVLVTLYYVKSRSWWPGLLLLLAFSVGLVHFSYLRLRLSSFSRTENMYMMNEPKGSHEEMSRFYNRLKREKKFCFFVNERQDSLYYRQVLPKYYAMAAGGVVGYHLPSLHRAIADKQFSAILVQEFRHFDEQAYNSYYYEIYSQSENYTFLKITGLKHAQQ